MADSPFVGPTYPVGSKPTSVARTVNLIPVAVEPGNESHSWVFKDVSGLRNITTTHAPIPLPLWLWLDGEHPPVRVRQQGTTDWHYSESYQISEMCTAAGGIPGPFATCSILLEAEGAPVEDVSGNDRLIIRRPTSSTQTTNKFGGYTGDRAIGNSGTDLTFVNWWVEVGEPLPLQSGQWRFKGAVRTASIASQVYPVVKQNCEAADGYSTERPSLYIWFSAVSLYTPLTLHCEGWASTTEYWSLSVVVERAAWTYIDLERNDDGTVGYVTLSVDGVAVATTATVVGDGGGTAPATASNLWFGRTMLAGAENLSEIKMDAIQIYTVDT